MGRTEPGFNYLRYDIKYNPFFKVKVFFTSFLPGFPPGYVTWERIERECHIDKVDESLPTLEDLDVCLTHMEDQVPWELRPLVIEESFRRNAKEPLPVSKPPIPMT